VADNPYAKYANPYAGMTPIGVPDPTKPLDLKSKQIGVQKGEAELQLTPYQLRKQKAEAQKAEIDARNAQEQYDAQHPSANTTGLYGDAFLKTLSPSDQAMVKGLTEGRLAFPQGAALRAPFWQEKLSQVAQFDPTFDATNFNARAAARKNAISGKLGNANNALNTAIGHVGTLAGQIDGTASHGGFPFATTVNAVENYLYKKAGDPGVTNYVDTASKLADELEAAYRNGGGAEAGVTRQLRNLDPNMSREQKEGIVRNAIDLLASKMAANLSQYNFGTGGKPTWDMLDPHALETLNTLAPDIRDKYFVAPAGSPQTPPTEPPAIGGGNGPSGPATPPSGPQIGPSADYSGLTGGPNQALAQGGVFTPGYRNVYDPASAAGIAALIRKGRPVGEANAYATSRGFQPIDPSIYAKAVAFAKTHHGAVNVQADKSVPTTFWQRAASSPEGAFAAGVASGGTAGLSDLAGRLIGGEAYDANRDALSATHGTADLLGNVVGGATGMIGGGGVLANYLAAGAKGGIRRNALAWAARNPVKAAILGDIGYGGTYGAATNPDNPGEGAAIGGITGLTGSVLGTGASRAVGGALRGVVNPAAQRLQAAGIPLTAGEILGGGWKKAQDAMTSVFGPGNMVARRYAEGRRALNQAAFNEAGQIIGAPINRVGQAGIEALDAAKNRAYSDALDPVTLDLNNPQAIGDLTGAVNSARAIPNVDQASDLATGALANYIGNAAPAGIMSGRDFQQAYRGLSRTARQSSDRIYGHEIGQSLGQGQDALVGALQNQNPLAYANFLRANRANRHLSVLTDAVNAAKNQVSDNGEQLFTPAQLGTAATSNARTYSGKVAAASGERPFNQLALDAQQVMSSKLGDSGTAMREAGIRLATGAGLAAAGGGLGYGADGGEGAAEGAAIPLGVLSLLGTRRAQQAAALALLRRNNPMRVAGQAIIDNPQVGGGLLTASGLPLLPYSTNP